MFNRIDFYIRPYLTVLTYWKSQDLVSFPLPADITQKRMPAVTLALSVSQLHSLYRPSDR